MGGETCPKMEFNRKPQEVPGSFLKLRVLSNARKSFIELFILCIFIGFTTFV